MGWEVRRVVEAYYLGSFLKCRDIECILKVQPLSVIRKESVVKAYFEKGYERKVSQSLFVSLHSPRSKANQC